MKKMKFLSTVKSKVILAVLIVVVISTIINLWFIIPNVQNSITSIDKSYMYDLTESTGKILDNKLEGVSEEDAASMYEEILAGIGLDGISSSYVYLVSADGTMLYHPTAEKIGKPVENSVVLGLVDQLKSGKVPEPAIVEYLFKGATKYAGYYITKDASKIVVLSADEKEFLRPVSYARNVCMIASAVAAVLSILIGIFYAALITKPIKKITKIVGKVSDLDFSKDEDLIELSTEFGESGDMARAVVGLTDAVSGVVSEIIDSSHTLSDASTTMNKNAEETANTIEQVERAVTDIADGATNQAQETQKATENVILIGNMIEETSLEVENIRDNSNNVKAAGEQATSILNELNNTNAEAKKAIDVIYEQTHTTNESALQIREVIAIITSIAEETNLLSLNASIEAARAGEQGRGFAVVASQIQKLAEQSNQSASQIDAIINSLINDSNMAVSTMDEVKSIMDKQSENVSETEKKFVEVKEGIDGSISGIETIVEKTKKMDEARIAVVDVVQNLTAIAEENAASTQETSASVSEVATIITDVSENAKKLNEIALKLDDIMKKFKTE